MTLEESILELTSITPSGGRCTLGDVSFKVWYCSDIWEWEYRGETFFDAEDLAAAIRQGAKAAPESASIRARKVQAEGRPPHVKHTPMAVSLNTGSAYSDSPSLRMGLASILPKATRPQASKSGGV